MLFQKKCILFLDKGDRSVSLRPELTAPVVRAFIENGLHHKACDRFFYMGPCFRYDRMQKGRYRQFHQFGCEAFGQKDPALDAEIIEFLMHLYAELGVKNISLNINTVGTKEIRSRFAKALQDYFTPIKSKLSEDSQRRLITNPMRILDSKEDRDLCARAPSIQEFLSLEERTFFESVCSHLSVPYKLDASLVRGLDYYCDTVFEVVSVTDTGAQNALGGGGRYDGLMKALGGEDLPGFGFGTGIERVLQHIEIPPLRKGPEFYLIPLSEEAKDLSNRLARDLRKNNVSVLVHRKNYNAKKGLQQAVALQATQAVLIGDEEIQSRMVTIKQLATREERRCSYDELAIPHSR